MKVLCNYINNINSISVLAQRRTDNTFEHICHILIILGIFFSPFSMIHIEWIPSYISVFLSYVDKLSMYPLLLFSMLWLFRNIKYKRIKLYIPLMIFFVIYFVVSLIVVIHGDMVFPYYDMADYSKLTGGDAVAFQFISSLFNFSTSKTNWIVSNVIKSCITITTGFYCSYFIIFSIFLFYIETKNDYLYDAWIAVSCILPFIFVYEIFEFAYLLGYEWGASFLKIVNPILYPINIYGSKGDWWPPVFWDQVRSVFTEPSLFSYWGALTLPIFMVNILHKRKLIVNSVELLFTTFIILASFSRTGIALVIGCNTVFIILCIIKSKRKFLFSVFAYLFILIFSFICASHFVSSSKTSNRMERAVETVNGDTSNSIVDNYLSGTVGTLTNIESRSNKSRYSIAEAQLNVFFDHPLLGVSEQLLGQYASDELNTMGILNSELLRWQSRQANGAIVNSHLPALNEYFYTLAYGGIFLAMLDTFLFVCIVLYSFIIFIFKKNGRTENMLVSITLSAVVCAFGVSGLFSNNFLYFIVFSYLLLANFEICTKDIGLKVNEIYRQT